MPTFLETVEHLASSMAAASVHIVRQVSVERDAATHAALHRLSVMLNDCQRAISDLLQSASPELRAKINALTVDANVVGESRHLNQP
jgi:hypothetical protein